MSSSPSAKKSAVSTKQPRIRRKVRALDYPKRPLSAYNLFFKSEQPVILAEYKREHDGEVDFPSIVKLVARRWRQLGDEDRLKYEEMAEKNSDEYRQELWEYQKGKKKEKLEAKKRKAEAESSLPPTKAVLKTADEQCDSSVTGDEDDSSIEVIEAEDIQHASANKRNKINKTPHNTGKRTNKRAKLQRVEDASSHEEEKQKERGSSTAKQSAPRADDAGVTTPGVPSESRRYPRRPAAASPPTTVARTGGTTVASLPQGDFERILLQHRAPASRDIGGTTTAGGSSGQQRGYPPPPQQQGRGVLIDQDREAARNMLIQDLRAIEAARDETIHRLIRLEDSPSGAATTHGEDVSIYQLIDHRGASNDLR
eukprot:Nitzschia sp. Nitz4//scaffold164_size50480//47139//48356//NITZ4_007010-RA/size50480-snap-gene-0.55-mRNA-1//1//CDS//3329538098//7063//frame0